MRVDPGNSTRIEIDIAVDRDAPLKTDSVAKISTLGPLTDNYIEIATGTEHAPLAPPGSELPSAEAFGLPQLGDAVQGMMPDVHKAVAEAEPEPRRPASHHRARQRSAERPQPRQHRQFAG